MLCHMMWVLQASKSRFEVFEVSRSSTELPLITTTFTQTLIEIITRSQPQFNLQRFLFLAHNFTSFLCEHYSLWQSRLLTFQAHLVAHRKKKERKEKQTRLSSRNAIETRLRWIVCGKRIVNALTQIHFITFNHKERKVSALVRHRGKWHRSAKQQNEWRH